MQEHLYIAKLYGTNPDTDGMRISGEKVCFAHNDEEAKMKLTTGGKRKYVYAMEIFKSVCRFEIPPYSSRRR